MGVKRSDFINLNELNSIMDKCEHLKKGNRYNEYAINCINCLDKFLQDKINNSGKFNLEFFNK